VTRLTGQVVLVAGGAGALGAAVSEAIVAEGGRVVVCDRNGDAASLLAERLGPAASATTLDVVEPLEWRALVEDCRHRFDRIDGLVNCAGHTSVHRLENLDQQTLSSQTEQCYFGVVYGMQAVFPLLRDSGGGSIVSIGSISARFAVGFNAAYAASQAAVEALSRCAALEWGTHGIRVNTIAAGMFDTPMTSGGAYAQLGNMRERVAASVPLQRPGDPCELAAAVVFLLSPGSAFCTGSTLTLDGGQNAGRLRVLSAPAEVGTG
jgi:3alpha(or 20beta)-hydroxysteroid dehydrogenase